MQHEMEETVSRQLKTIENLIREKEKLSSKCVDLGKELKTIEEKYTKAVRLEYAK